MSFQRLTEFAFWHLVKLINSRSPFFVSCVKRPKSGFFSNSLNIKRTNLRVAIIIQGPLVEEDNFTFETIRLYKTIFPGALIILSTWQDRKIDYRGLSRNINIEIIENAQPVNAGRSNVNLQIKSSLAGLELARERGCHYSIKTRTDQRISNPETIDFLYSLIKKFPTATSWQKDRIIVTSLNTFKYRMYSLSDMFMFGTTSDLVNYWSCAYDLKHKDEKKYVTMREWSELRRAEVYLLTEYLRRNQEPILGTLRHSWEIYTNCFIVIDAFSLDLFWRKYSWTRENRNRKYGQHYTSDEFDFSDWITQQSGAILFDEKLEQVADFPFNRPIPNNLN